VLMLKVSMVACERHHTLTLQNRNVPCKNKSQ